jgi:oxygen-independent coproporphyrinogen-3 oxidase
VQQPLSLYLHIPFCDTKCSYCDFNSYAGMESLIPAYTRALTRELRLWAQSFADDELQTVFFGGGTPSLTPLAEMESILAAIDGSYRLARGVELSLEANPGTVDAAYLSGLRRLGFNRLSLGVQSFDDAELRALDRIHSAQQAEDAFRAARAAGFENVSLDLIYGLAGQALAGWRANVERALRLRPEHLSLYALTIEEGTPLAVAVSRGRAASPDPDLQADMYELAQELLATAGYEQYEISNWALPGRACRHNLAYWRNARWLGAGAGAHSSLPGCRFATARAPRAYIRRVEQARDEAQRPGAALGPLLDCMPQVVWREPIDAVMAMSDTAILGLRLLEGISPDEFRERHGVDLFSVYGDELHECIDLGLLELTGGRLRLRRERLLVASEVFSRLLPKAAAA